MYFLHAAYDWLHTIQPGQEFPAVATPQVILAATSYPQSAMLQKGAAGCAIMKVSGAFARMLSDMCH